MDLRRPLPKQGTGKQGLLYPGKGFPFSRPTLLIDVPERKMRNCNSIKDKVSLYPAYQRGGNMKTEIGRSVPLKAIRAEFTYVPLSHCKAALSNYKAISFIILYSKQNSNKNEFFREKIERKTFPV